MRVDLSGARVVRLNAQMFPLSETERQLLERYGVAPVEIEAARHMVMKAAWDKDQGNNYDISSAMAKLHASKVAMDVTVEAVQVHGGNGFVKEYQIDC